MSYRRTLAGALSVCLAVYGSAPAWAADVTPERSVSLLQLRVVQGEGAMHAPGSRTGAVLTVLVTDETGQPLSRVPVSFRLPEEGPSGTFANGLKTEVVVTAADGRAVLQNVRWGSTPGSLHLRVMAVKGAARAGILCAQTLDASAPAEAAHKKNSSLLDPNKALAYRKWVLLGLALAGVTGGGVAAKKGLQKSTPPPLTPLPTPPTVGVPTVTIGGPH